jgi:hypothetical protein
MRQRPSLATDPVMTMEVSSLQVRRSAHVAPRLGRRAPRGGLPPIQKRAGTAVALNMPAAFSARYP